jgi:hypothetical protein
MQTEQTAGAPLRHLNPDTADGHSAGIRCSTSKAQSGSDLAMRPLRARHAGPIQLGGAAVCRKRNTLCDGRLEDRIELLRQSVFGRKPDSESRQNSLISGMPELSRLEPVSDALARRLQGALTPDVW